MFPYEVPITSNGPEVDSHGPRVEGMPIQPAFMNSGPNEQPVASASCNSLPRESLVKEKPSSSSRYGGECAVCKDKASGFHYGVLSCEGCKVGLNMVYSHFRKLPFLFSEWPG